ncbi:PilW family protein [Priestia flexa]|uniref:PilW family protein n=1 Tax=Priestia flexa TaxID=86664 RepID=UPI000955370A|nr:prepilin-type N-terminal cleavage/methylation domain-containing protein [Priestia flexa]MBY6085301.1 prepilin-type N-terminal cleavage/methylation domain-containing protein [Priestia flexa]MCA1200818.1 prepilin-type N-terminal cleavage/methylation domain-containing protein [Priestia flexa]SIQ40399.1 prepilin-type N-terminal cleavage/methylation domain-containing protein [Priestia flexa]
MKIFAKLINNEQGLTLTELLATMVVLTIVMGITYSVFVNGITVSKKIGIEEQIRDDADYIITMMMNELTEKGFDTFEDCSPRGEKGTCISLADRYAPQYDEYRDSENSSDVFYDVESKERPAAEQTTSEIELIATGSEKKVAVNSLPLESEADFSDSKFTISCAEEDSSNRCIRGLLDVVLIVKHPDLDKKLTLSSKFGF